MFNKLIRKKSLDNATALGGNRIFIIGVMKGGTSALYENLRMHPNIFHGKKKEHHYYSLNYQLGRDWYESHFPRVNEGEYTLDASPSYFSEASNVLIPSLIKKDFPNCKTILILRDPVTRSISHFNHLRKINKVQCLIDIDVNDFFSIDFQKTIAPSTTIEWYLKNILKVSDYLWPYYQYKQIMDRKDLLVVTNESLLNHPEITMNQVFNYLSLSEFYSQDFKKIKFSYNSKELKVTKETIDKLKTCFYPGYRKLVNYEGFKMNLDT